MNPDLLRRAVVPLHLIFWGSIIAALDIHSRLTFGGGALLIGPTKDVIAALVIATGTARLAWLPVRASFRWAMLFLTLVAGMGMADAILQVFLPSDARLGVLLHTGLGYVVRVAIPAFALAMGWLCEDAGFRIHRRIWRIAFWLFLAVQAVDLAVMLAADLVGSWGMTRFVVGIPMAVVQILTLMLLLFATHKTGRACADPATEAVWAEV